MRPWRFESVDDIHRDDGLASGMLSIGHSVANDTLEEDLEHITSLLIDETGDTLYTTTTSQTADGGLGDALDIIAQNLAMALRTSLSQSLSSFAAARHVGVLR